MLSGYQPFLTYSTPSTANNKARKALRLFVRD